MKNTSLFIAGVITIVSGCATTAHSPAYATSGAAEKYASSDMTASADTADNARASASNAAPGIPASGPASIEGLTIEEALRLAEANRPDLEALRRRIGMAAGEAQQAGLWPNPTLSLGLEGYTPNGDSRPPDLTTLGNLATLGNRSRTRASAIQEILFPGTPSLVPAYELWVPGIPGPRDSDQLQQVISLSQPLPIWGTRRLARKAGLLEMEHWRHEYERARLALRSQVKKAFDEVVFVQLTLDATLDLDRTLVEILDVTRAKLEAGDIAEVELIKGEADYERFALEIESTRAQLSQAKTRLARTLGDPDITIQSCASALSSDLPELPEIERAKMRDDHPQIKVWEASDEAASAQVAVAESRRLPVPTLGIGYRHFEFTDQDTFDLTLDFELPIFDRKQGDIHAAREKAAFESATNEAEKNGVDAALVQTLAAYESHRRKVDAFQQRILPKMEESLSIARTRFDAGDTSMLEVLDAYRSLAEARLAYLNEAYETRAAYFELEYLFQPAAP